MNVNRSTKENEKLIKVLNKIINFVKKLLTKFKLSGRRGSNSRPLAWKANALSTELLPLLKRWGEQDSNLRRRTPADLQSAPVGHFGISPEEIF